MGDGGQTFINRGTIAADTTINMGGGDDTFQVEGSSATFYRNSDPQMVGLTVLTVLVMYLG